MLIPLIVACALFMENLDSSVVSTSLPEIARDLAVDPIALKLVEGDPKWLTREYRAPWNV